MKLKFDLKNMKLAEKLRFGFGVVISLTVLSYIVIYIITYRNNSIVKEINTIHNPSAELSKDLYNMIAESKMLIKNWVFIEQKSETPDKIKLIELHKSAYPKKIQEINSIKSKWNDGEQQRFGKIQKSIDSLFALHKSIMDQLNTIDSYKDPMVMMTVNSQVDENGEVIQLTERIKNDLNNFYLSLQKELHDKTAQMQTSFQISKIFIIFMGILIALLGLFITYLTIRGIIAPIQYLKGIIILMGQGILPSEKIAHRNDEIGEIANALNIMVDKLKEIISEIKHGSSQLVGASNQIASSSQNLSQGANSQAASIEEISSSLEEMLATVQQNAENALQTERIAIKAADDMDEGNKSMISTINSMRQIADKTSIIGEIANRTDLLAINAAVEAARAGENGKGFAVVATEVRKLAERSQRAANEIQGFTKNSVSSAEKSGIMLTELLPNIKNTSRLVQEIAAASSEQNNGLNQINSSIQQLTNISQTTAATAEEMSSSAEELASHASHLNNIMSFFKIGESDESQITELTAQARKLLDTVEIIKNKNKNARVVLGDQIINESFENKVINKIADFRDNVVSKRNHPTRNLNYKINKSSDKDEEFEKY